MSQTDSYLVLCVEERDSEKYDLITNRLFLAYDSENDTYVVYGKRQNIREQNDCVPYFFRADKSIDMYKFVKFVVSNSFCSYTLYNYNNISIDLEDTDYDTMENNMDANYDIESYDMMIIKMNPVRELMHILKNVYNVY